MVAFALVLRASMKNHQKWWRSRLCFERARTPPQNGGVRASGSRAHELNPKMVVFALVLLASTNSPPHTFPYGYAKTDVSGPSSVNFLSPGTQGIAPWSDRDVVDRRDLPQGVINHQYRCERSGRGCTESHAVIDF